MPKAQDHLVLHRPPLSLIARGRKGLEGRRMGLEVGRNELEDGGNERTRKRVQHVGSRWRKDLTRELGFPG